MLCAPSSSFIVPQRDDNNSIVLLHNFFKRPLESSTLINMIFPSSEPFLGPLKDYSTESQVPKQNP